MFVKICGITTEDDALLATALGADAVGFVFAPSTRQVHPEGVRDIVKRLPTDVLPVGVFRNDRPEHVVDVAGRVGLHAVQLSGAEPVSEVRWIRERVRFVIQGFAAGDPALGAAANSPADVVLVDSPSPGSGKVFDWRLAEGAPGGVRLMIAGGLTPENVGEAIRLIRPWGVDVATGVEARPGQKDPRKLRRFIEIARQAANDAADPLPTALGDYPDDDDTVAGVTRPWDWQLDQ
jgi:phosphoribosylanthranilate isomerase